jgi:hypothetical protein
VMESRRMECIVRKFTIDMATTVILPMSPFIRWRKMQILLLLFFLALKIRLYVCTTSACIMTFDHIHQFVLDCPIQGWEEHLNQTLALLQSFAMMKKTTEK